MLKSINLYFQSSILKICLFGLINGMALLISSNTINFWLASFKVDIEIIGYFALIFLPHSFKYLFAIFIDSKKIPYLSNKVGNYRAWLILSQFFLSLTLYRFSMLNPASNLIEIAILGFILSSMAVIQYVILNGNRILVLPQNQQGAGSAIYNIGYRLGMFFTGAGVIYLSIFFNWKNIYLILTISYIFLSFIILKIYQEPNHQDHEKWIKENQSLLHNIFIAPINHFHGYKNFFAILILILFYQIADSMMMSMLNPFLLEKSYSPEEIASASKICGLIMVIVGGFVGGVITDKINIKQSLLLFAFIHSLGYLMFIGLSFYDKNLLVLYFVTGYSAFTGGMAATAYLSFISNLSQGKHAITLYALLSSIVGLAWAIFPSFSGIIVKYIGWTKFFMFISLIGFGAVILTALIPKNVYKLAKNK